MLIVIGVLSIGGNHGLVGKWARRMQVRMHVRFHQFEFEAQLMKDDFELRKRGRDEAKFAEDLESGKIVAIKCPVASVSTGDWMRKVEWPIFFFARTNHIEILRFQGIAGTNHVCVWTEDAPRMTTFVNSLTNQPKALPPLVK